MIGRARGLVVGVGVVGALLVSALASAGEPTRLKLPSPDEVVDLEAWLKQHLTGTEVVIEGPDGATKWGASLAEALIMTPAAGKIESLTIRYEAVGPDGAEVLASSSNLKALRRLGLSGHQIGDRGAEALALSDLSLVALDVSGNDLGADGIAALLGSEVTAALEWLALAGNPLGAEGAKAIASAAHVEKVTWLSLDNTRLGRDGAKALAAAKHLAPTELSLRSNSIGPAGAKALAASEVLGSVRRLDLADNAIGAAGARALAKSGALDAVESLDLSRNDLSREGAQAIADGSFPSMTTLRLSRNSLGDEGAVALAAATGLPRLVHADLTRNGIGFEGGRAIASSATFDKTSEVGIWGKSVARGRVPTDKALARAVKAFRKIRRQRESAR